MKFKLLIAAFGLLMAANTIATAAGSAAAGEGKSAMCAGCHAADGNSVVNLFPKLAGQHAGYIAKQLGEFKSGKREDATMQGMAAALSEEDMADLAAFYSSKTAAAGAADDEAKVALGQDVFRGGNSSTHVPACMGCHGATGKGNPAAKFPALAGQHAVYTIKQLKAFRNSVRANDANSMMRKVAEHMSDAEIEAVANYIAGMK